MSNTYSNYEGDVIIPEYVTFSDESEMIITEHCWNGDWPQKANIYYLGKTFHVTEISQFAFDDENMNATSISFPKSINTMNGARISKWAFELKSITFRDGFSANNPETFFMLGRDSYNSPDEFHLEEIHFPEEGHINIGKEAFFKQVHISTLRLSNSIHHVSEKAFYNCSGLERLSIGKNVESIDAEAFGQCDNIKEIAVEAETPPTIDSTTFSDITYQTATLTVPEGSEEAYRAAEGWKLFFARETDSILETEGMDEMMSNRQEDSHYYTIDGISVDQPLKKNIYIHQGKKIIRP